MEALDNSIYQLTGKESSKLILLRGYSGGNTDYRDAKKPKGVAWTYISENDLSRMEETGEWAGLVIPEGRILCDIDDPLYFARIHEGLKRLRLKHVAVLTPNGGQLIFRDSGAVKTQSAKMITLGGFVCDYRLPGKGYIVLPMPHTEGRQVIHADEEPASMPSIFLPVRRYGEEKDAEKILPYNIGEGSRDDSLFRHAARVKEWNHKYRLALDDAARLEVLQAVNLIFCEPPLSDREIEQKHRSAEKTVPISSPEVQITMTVKAATIREFLGTEFKPRETILSPWLPSQGLAMIHAYRGVGKTHVALGSMVAIASGDTFLRFNALRPHGVLYIDGEMPGRVLQERLARIVASAKKEPTAPIKIITPDLQEFGMPDLSTIEGQALIEEHLDGISVVVVDNLSTLCRSGVENKAEDWLPVQEWGLTLRRRGLSVLFVHHTGKGGAQRGTSRREDVLDTVIHLKRPGDYRPEDGAHFEIHFEKARGLYGDDVKPFEAKLGTGPDGKQTWLMKDIEESLTDKVAELLNDGVSQSEIPELLNVAKGTVSKHKKKAEALGLLGKK